MENISIFHQQFYKSCFKDFKFFTEYSRNFTRNVSWNQAFPSLSIAIRSSFLYKAMMYTLRNLKHWKVRINLPCCWFIFSHLQLHHVPLSKVFLIHFKNKNRWILFLAVPSLVFNFKSRKSNKLKLYLIFNTKLT